MIETIKKIAELQPRYSSKNTPAMKERGRLIRKELPKCLRTHWPQFEASLGKYSDDMVVEGSDGIGRKTQAPWVRIYSESLSPSATTGWYVVIHFSARGDACFVTVGCGATKWDSDKGDLVKDSDEEMARKINWGKSVLGKISADTTMFPDKIDIGSKHALPKSFEKATLLCKRFVVDEVTEDELVNTIAGSLRLLAMIYVDYSQFRDLPQSELSDLTIDIAINPLRKRVGSRQGYGLSGPERKAVENRAMEVTRKYLEGLGFETKDTSNKKPYDYLAKKGGLEVKIEVKGTTSLYPDSVMMTSNEVELHKAEAGGTALAIVSGVILDQRGPKAMCSGGELEYFYPWTIDDWTLEPKAFLVVRPSKQSG